jgi:indolepyruvate ferredoxin oxidoreductase beta subunit
VKLAVKGRKAVFCGDIGCYTLGNAQPLDMVDTCLCMGADVTIAQGIKRTEPDTLSFAFIGDSTFFASGITGVVNAVYNNTDIILVVLDNSTTAMTGHQPHPGTGIKMTQEIGTKISIENVLTALGVASVKTADPLNLTEAQQVVKEAAELKGVKAIIFRSPCINVTKASEPYIITDRCINCIRCIKELGCPAITTDNSKVKLTSRSASAARSARRSAPLELLKGTASLSKNILLCGVGGQGTVLASRLIASAAMEKGLNVRTAETIGMAQRGGCVVSHVRTGSEIHSPLIPTGSADVIIGFEPAEAVRNLSFLKPGGTVVVNNRAIKPVTSSLGGSAYIGAEMLDWLKANVKNLLVVDGDGICARLGSPKVLNTVLLAAAVKTAA